MKGAAQALVSLGSKNRNHRNTADNSSQKPIDREPGVRSARNFGHMCNSHAVY